MQDRWENRALGVYPTYVLLIVLVTFVVSVLAVAAFNLRPLEVLAVASLSAMAAILAFTILYVIARMAMRWFRRASTDRIIIGHIASLVRQKLPLAPGIMLAAASEQGLARRHLERVARPLAAGFSLTEAIRIGWQDCPALVYSLILAGERTGQLAIAIEQAEQYLIQRARRHSGANIPVCPYAILVVSMTMLLTGGVMIAIVPKFKEIFKDFGAQLPPATVALIDVSEWFAHWGWPLLVLLGMGTLAALYLDLRPRRVPLPWLTSRIADWLRWHTPGLRRLEWSRAVSAAMRALGMGLHAGLDVPAAARLAADLDINAELRWRLDWFAEMIEAGCDVREAAARSGLGHVAGLALASGLRGRDIDAAIRYAVDYHDAIISRWWLIFKSMAWPVTTLAMGMVVAFVVVSLFVPLVTLIDSTARWFP